MPLVINSLIPVSFYNTGEEFDLKDLKRNIDTIRNDLKILQETVNQYYKDNNIKKLEQIKIEE